VLLLDFHLRSFDHSCGDPATTACVVCKLLT
jgi:hypothetical protein